ncbi:MAG: tetratricopeptide repeat protein [Verrucomicrobiota bacterium]
MVIEIGLSGVEEFEGEKGFSELVRRQNATGHRGYVGLLEAGVDDGLTYGVRRFVPGEELDKYLSRVGRLALSETIDLGLAALNVIFPFRGTSEADVPELETGAIVRVGDGQTIYLAVLGPRVDRLINGEVAPGGEIGESELVRRVCSLMHRAATGARVELGASGRRSPNLGDLPEELRYLMWAAFEKSGKQKPMGLSELRSLLVRLRDQVPDRPLPEASKPVCRLESLIFGEFRSEEFFDGHFEEIETQPSFREFVSSAYSRRLERQPFRYRMQLQVLPALESVGHSDYTESLSLLGDDESESQDAILQTCAIDSRNGFQYVVEERLNGFSLAEVSLRRGGFDASETLYLLERIEDGLKVAAQFGRTPWNLRAEELFVEFESHLSRQELLEESRAPIDDWPKHRIVIRLHPTLSTLVRGSLLPVCEDGFGNDPDGREMAAIAWQLLSFSCQDARPIGEDGCYRSIPRLSREGNAFLRKVIEAKSRSSEDKGVEVREQFIRDFEAALDVFSFREFAEPEVVEARPANLHATSPVELLSDPTRPALRSTRRLEEAGGRRRNRKLVRRILGHAVSLSIAGFLIGATVAVIHPESRERVFAFAGGVADRILGVGAETEKDWELPGFESHSEPTVAGPVAEDGGLELVSMSGDVREEVLPIIRESLLEEAEVCTTEIPESEELNSAEMAEAAESIDELLVLLGRTEDGLRAISERTLRLGVATGSVMANLELGRRLTDSFSPHAIPYLQKAADEGVVEARMLIGKLLLSGAEGVPMDEMLAFEHLRHAAEHGDREAMEEIGARVVRGAVVPGVGFAEGKQYLKAAAELGGGKACSLLGAMYLNGMGVEEDVDKAFSLFERSARAGDPDGMLYYARCLNSGIGTAADRGRSAEWFAKAARAGNEKAKEWCRENGESVDELAASPGA